MDYETVTASLTGLDLLVTNEHRSAVFLQNLFGMSLHHSGAAFTMLTRDRKAAHWRRHFTPQSAKTGAVKLCAALWSENILRELAKYQNDKAVGEGVRGALPPMALRHPPPEYFGQKEAG